MNTTQELTDRQHEILRFIVNFAKRHGFPPTVREIGEFMGSKNPTAAVSTLRALERKGFIQRTPTVSRGLKIITR